MDAGRFLASNVKTQESDTFILCLPGARPSRMIRNLGRCRARRWQLWNADAGRSSPLRPHPRHQKRGRSLSLHAPALLGTMVAVARSRWGTWPERADRHPRVVTLQHYAPSAPP